MRALSGLEGRSCERAAVRGDWTTEAAEGIEGDRIRELDWVEWAEAQLGRGES